MPLLVSRKTGKIMGPVASQRKIMLSGSKVNSNYIICYAMELTDLQKEKMRVSLTDKESLLGQKLNLSK